MQTINDAQLIRRMKGGDKKALEEIYDRYYKAMLLMGCSMIHRPQEVEDAIQDCFVGFWERRASLSEHDMNIGAYLIGAIRKRCKDYIRRIAILYKYLDEYAARQQEENSPFPPRNEELMLAIDLAIKSLPWRLKQVFEAKHIHGYRAKEIAAQTGLSDQTIKGYLADAMILLRAKLIIYVK